MGSVSAPIAVFEAREETSSKRPPTEGPAFVAGRCRAGWLFVCDGPHRRWGPNRHAANKVDQGMGPESGRASQANMTNHPERIQDISFCGVYEIMGAPLIASPRALQHFRPGSTTRRLHRHQTLVPYLSAV